MSVILSEAISYIERNYLKEIVVKYPDKPQAERFWNFPIGAIEEALVNAIYHRSYEEREPVEVRITGTHFRKRRGSDLVSRAPASA